MKNFLIVFLLVAVVAAGIYFIKSSKKTHEDLWAHFQKSGLTVQTPPALSQADQAALDQAKEAFKSLGSGQLAYEEQDRIINSILVDVRRYPNNQKALEGYDISSASEATSKRRAEQNDGYYARTDYYVNENFVLLIRHFIVHAGSGTLTPTDLELDPNDLNKIVTAFKAL